MGRRGGGPWKSGPQSPERRREQRQQQGDSQGSRQVKTQHLSLVKEKIHMAEEAGAISHAPAASRLDASGVNTLFSTCDRILRQLSAVLSFLDPCSTPRETSGNMGRRGGGPWKSGPQSPERRREQGQQQADSQGSRQVKTQHLSLVKEKIHMAEEAGAISTRPV
ncbi:hypothetical protein EYF80_060903 [Liparis tanakae]|uniref:Uncharacterized protein n=1 Tax=Liparis tanakae TaxID=230148 RepID=A0A4Z2EJH6_9TELE|nr:hypothetical protein EYF80_060903 [Liparis tanakae]